MTKPLEQDVAYALREIFVSPYEMDSNGEPANVVDGLFALARAMAGLSDALVRVAEMQKEATWDAKTGRS